MKVRVRTRSNGRPTIKEDVQVYRNCLSKIIYRKTSKAKTPTELIDIIRDIVNDDKLWQDVAELTKIAKKIDYSLGW